MKKKTLILFLLLTALVSCDQPSKTVQNTNEKPSDTVQATKTDGTQITPKDTTKIAALYQCPMDCEKGKTYDKPGICPKCKMELKKK